MLGCRNYPLSKLLLLTTINRPFNPSCAGATFLSPPVSPHETAVLFLQAFCPYCIRLQLPIHITKQNCNFSCKHSCIHYTYYNVYILHIILPSIFYQYNYFSPHLTMHACIFVPQKYSNPYLQSVHQKWIINRLVVHHVRDLQLKKLGNF